MNNLLRNLIDSNSVAFVINDILVAIDTKKRYDKILEEVLKK